jgi:integrase/recombinase XerD
MIDAVSLTKEYRVFLQLEKSLSVNTVEAYLDDLDKLLRYLDAGGKDVCAVSLEDLREMIYGLHDMGISPRTQSRIVSGIRSFFRFLCVEGYIGSDPSELLESPKLGLTLPVFLTLDEVNRIIGSIDLSQPEGQRNRAILETLYSCGLRVSELVGLCFPDLYLDEGFIRVTGKGSKQRLVPVSPVAVKEIRMYLLDRAGMEVKSGFEDVLFLNRRGAKLTRVMVFYIVKRYCALAGVRKTVGPHTFRHSFATHLLEGGANLRAIQMMLGHEKITTTEIYSHVDRDFIRSEILEHHPRNRNPFFPS